jgi:hypothetical protein
MAKSVRTKKSGKDVLERRREKREKASGTKRLRKTQRVG